MRNWTEFLGRAIIVALLICMMIEWQERLTPNDLFGWITFGIASIILFIWACKSFPFSQTKPKEKK